ncbi:MAG: hypothetical protein ACJAVI_002139 [Candidatus Azotimanducaceae bacterium]|jgi:hypothetical protein
MNRNIQANAEKDIQNRLSSAPLRHSQLAMSAAKRMSRARKKERVGRVVCHHLLQMLASDTSVCSTSVCRTGAAVNQDDFALTSLDSNGNLAKDGLSLVSLSGQSQERTQQAEQYSLSI